MPEVRTLLGFDFGEVRIGVAVGNTLTGSAQYPEDKFTYSLVSFKVPKEGDSHRSIIVEFEPTHRSSLEYKMKAGNLDADTVLAIVELLRERLVTK